MVITTVVMPPTYYFYFRNRNRFGSTPTGIHFYSLEGAAAFYRAWIPHRYAINC